MQTIDVTGLPEPMIQALESLVATVRTQKAGTAESQVAETSRLSPEEWVREFDAFVSRQKPISGHVDDSRESIYDRAGE